MERKNKWKKWIIVFCVLIVLWGITIGVDYRTTMHGFEKPIFAAAKKTADDGGSGIYQGIGYSIEVEGDFMPEDEFPGVTYARFTLFGKEIKTSLRD